eukprot:COSAG01_NODE_17677_length_1132_cov_1.158761_2_plen_195_part_00
MDPTAPSLLHNRNMSIKQHQQSATHRAVHTSRSHAPGDMTRGPSRATSAATSTDHATVVFGCSTAWQRVTELAQQLLHLVLLEWFWIGFVLVAHDLWTGGLGTSNGKYISFIDSLCNCFDHRNQFPLVVVASPPVAARRPRRGSTFSLRSQHNTWSQCAWISIVGFSLKFLNSTITSLLYGGCHLLVSNVACRP